MYSILRRTAIGLLAVCAIVQIGGTSIVRASASGVVISQVYGGGGNTGATLKNDFIELFNAGSDPVDVTGWSVQYASSGGSSWQVTQIAGTIQPGRYFLVQEAKGTGGSVDLPSPDAVGTIAMSASSGKVALVAATAPLSGSCPPGVVDFVGFGTAANCFEGGAPTATLTNTTAAIRKNGGATDTDNNGADFVTGAPNPHSGGNLRLTTISSPPVASPGTIVTFVVNVTPGILPASTGISVVVDLSAFGGLASQPMFDDGTNGDVVAADNNFTLRVAVPPSIDGNPIVATATDGQARSAKIAIPLTLNLPIHAIQGPDTVSPLTKWSVQTQGIVTGVKVNGFFMQTPDTDADPNSSEGIFVFTSSTPPAAAVVGNGVQVTGTVSEFGTAGDPAGLSMTELTSPTVTPLSSGNALPEAVNLTASDLNPEASIFALEKYEGMRVHLDGVVSISPTDGTVSEANATSTSNGLFFGVLPGVARPFREAGIQTPLPVPSEAPGGTTPPVFDANPERIGVDTFSVFLDPSAAKVVPPAGATLEVTTGVTVTNITGPLDYSFRSYIVDAEGWNPPSATPNASAQSVRPRTTDEFTVATMNLARFFDTTDDPGKSDVALTPAAFDLRLSKASQAIRGVMQTPDVIGVEEVENLPTLQAIAGKVNADAAAGGLSGLHYDAYLEEGNDVGGIDVGFLVRSDKIVVNSVEQYGKDTTYVEPGGATAVLNDRPSLILRAEIQNAPYEPYPVTVVVNHLRSMSGIDGSDGARIRAKRLAQAVDLATKLQALQSSGEHVVSVGDYNAFSVNDGYVDVMGLLKGAEADASHVTLWAPSPVTPPLFDATDLAPVDQRYSFVFDGNAQELDHILASTDVHANAVGYARMNADFPESMRGDGSGPERLSDHDPIVGYFVLPDIDTHPPVIQQVTPSTTTLWPVNGKMIPVIIGVDATDAVGVAACNVIGVTGDDGATSADWTFSGLTANLAARRTGAGAGRTYTITVDCVDAAGNHSLPATTTVFVPHDMRR